ncbi:MAG: hypothetical protein COB08_010750 [Rhodobacteraceae bacterium]|nr:hypothetical protein [Paracoccaceae bacterium]
MARENAQPPADQLEVQKNAELWSNGRNAKVAGGNKLAAERLQYAVCGNR